MLCLLWKYCLWYSETFIKHVYIYMDMILLLLTAYIWNYLCTIIFEATTVLWHLKPVIKLNSYLHMGFIIPEYASSTELQVALFDQ